MFSFSERFEVSDLVAAGYKRAYEAVNYRLRTINGGRWAAHCRPTSIVILLSERCNARCVHCDIWKNRGQEESPTLEQWKTVVTDLRRWLGRVQVVFSGGEALLIPIAPQLISHASGLGLFVEHLTHGYWLDQSRIEQLALANPWRITISLDGIGETHSRIRGRDNFFEKTYSSIQTLKKLRKERSLDYTIRFKTVIMSLNLNDVCEVARFADRENAEVFYQPIEQNYNTQEDPRWFEHSPTWPSDTGKVIGVVEELIRLKKQGVPIVNSYAQLEAMIPYFKDPDSMRVSVQSHNAHEHRRICNATTMLQFQSNGDVTVCTGLKPVGNIKEAPIRKIWENRPHVWESGCCLEWRCTPAEKETLALPVLR
jgi:MoaA/NifB/PqqE/SkfB family radical SAM enzyme